MNNQVPGENLPPEAENGESLSAREYQLSLLVSLQMGAQWGHCYENAYPAFFALPSLFSPDGTFIEGWIVFEDAVHKVVLMEHGWLVSNTGHKVDPTIVLALDYRQPLYYFPGVVRSWQETDALNNEFFPHVRFSNYGADGMGHPGYHAAYMAALQMARSRLSPAKEFIEVRASEVSAGPQDGGEMTGMAAIMIVVPR